MPHTVGRLMRDAGVMGAVAATVHTQLVREGTWVDQCHATRFCVCAEVTGLSVKERLCHENPARTYMSRRRDTTQAPCLATSYNPAAAQGARVSLVAIRARAGGKNSNSM